METSRELIMEHGANIKNIERICTIRINENYPYKSIIARILRDLRVVILRNDDIFRVKKCD
jgi:hypothetical protein